MSSVVTVGSDLIWDEKYPSAVVPFTFDLTGVLPDGDSLTQAYWSVAPVGVTGGALVNASAFEGNLVTLWVEGGLPLQWYLFTCNWTSADQVVDSFAFRLYIRAAEVLSPTDLPMGTALFPNRFTATSKLQTDRLLLAGKSVLPAITLSDDYVWEKLITAESEMAHTLRVKFAPTTFFPLAPTQAQIDALAGAPWDIDPGYDYRSSFFQGESFGLIKLRNKPIVSVSKIRFAYPSPAAEFFDIPVDWVRADNKYGTIQLVPSTATFSAPLSAFFMQAIGGGKTIPFMIQITYVAGLSADDYPELLDIVKRAAVLKILEDAFVPSSGSISADGLSQSISTDMEKYRDMIEYVLNGPKGSNGGLMTAIHGIRMGVV